MFHPGICNLVVSAQTQLPHLHVDGVLDAGGLDVVYVDPAMDAHSVPRPVRRHHDHLRDPLDVRDEGGAGLDQSAISIDKNLRQ